MDDITFITGNKEKVAQLTRHFSLPMDNQKLDLPEIQSLEVKEVATHKAETAYKMLKKPVMVEDTALTFTALGKLPGPLVKWFLQTIGNEGMAQLLSSFDDRSAVAEVCFAVCDKRGVRLFHSSIKGTIAESPRGDTGFGWDPIFIPEGHEKTWGEMTYEEQHETSMRREALQKLQIFLEKRSSD